MAHYAFLDETNTVINLIKGRDENEVIDGISDWETYYSEKNNTICKRTSYNTFGNTHKESGTPFRKNYAEIGGTYSEELDAFIPVKPFPSWTLNEETCRWDAPSPCPVVFREPDKDDIDYPVYDWDELTLSWIIINP
jgi:hypothetical protein